MPTRRTRVAFVVAVALAGVLGAQEVPDAERLGSDLLAEVPEVLGPGGRFAKSLQAARSARTAAIAAAEAKYERTTSTLESATAALTVDARRRIEEGPLASAQTARDDAITAANRRYEHDMVEAVEAYGGVALAVYGAAVEVMEVLRTEYELYAVVIGAAEAALQSGVEGTREAAATGQFVETEYKAAETALAEARRVYDAAAAERSAARKSRPEDPKPDYGSSILGGLAAGLSDAVGDHERAGSIRRQLDREQSERLGQHADRTARYESRLAEASAALETANHALEAAMRRFNAVSARHRSARQASSSADTEYSAAYDARAVAGTEAARITRLHSRDELKAVTESLREGVLSAIAEIEEHVLAEVTVAAALQVLDSAIVTYADPRAAAIEAELERIESDYRDSLLSAESRYSDALARASSVVSGFKQAVLASEDVGQRSVRFADKRVEDALVRWYGRAKETRYEDSNLESATAAHKRALEAAFSSRLETLSRVVPAMRTTLARVGGKCYPIPYSDFFGARFIDAKDMVTKVRSHKAKRASLESEFGDCVGRAYLESSRASGEDALEEARQAAEDARKAARFGVVARLVRADHERAGRLRDVERHVLNGLVAAARMAL